MKKTILSKSFLFLTAIFLFYSVPARSEKSSFVQKSSCTLQDCYLIALKQSADLKILSERSVQFRELYRQAVGNIYPNLSFNASELLQDNSGNSTANGGYGSTFTKGDRAESKLTLRQSLFSGLREFSVKNSLESQTQKQEFLLKRASKNLFQTVASAFYLVIQNETDLKNIRDSLNLTQNRIKELQERIQLGKSRQSELFSAESQYASLKSQEEQIKGNVSTSRETLSLIMNTDMSSAPLSDHLLEIYSPESLETILIKAESRTDVQAVRKEMESNRQKLRMAKGAVYPTADLLGNYYAKRTGSQNSIDWDVLLNFKIPLFEGGSTMASIRQAESTLRESEWNLDYLKRTVRSEIKKNYLTLQSSVAQTKTLEEAFKKAEESYKLQVKEYRLGLVNNLEVLQSMTAMQDIKRNYDRSILANKLNQFLLKVSTEELP